MGHGHEPGQGSDGSRSAGRRALAITLALTTTYTVAEVIGGLLTGSLALLADAAHMLSDDLSLGLALFAVWLAQNPATADRTFGYKRAEILAALANGVTLVAISIWIFIEAYRRLEDPPEILGGWMLVVAVGGLLINTVAFAILHRGGSGESLNVSAATRHVVADLLGSIGVIIAALVIILTGWRYADPLVSVLVAILVLVSSWSILRDSVRILLEASPRDLDVKTLGRELAAIDGVREVHDLHVWTITSGFPALAAHVLVGEDVDCHAKRREIEELLHERHEIDHTTLQVDHAQPKLLRVEKFDPADERAAFIFADLAGFTALTAAHGDERAVELVEDFSRHTDSLLRRFGGERVKTIGDEVMLRVPDPTAAILLSLDMVNHEMAKPDHPAVRAGLHYGPAIGRDGDWYGSAVNIAARIAELAGEGEVLVSKAALDAAGEIAGPTFEDLGPQPLRNVPEPVVVLAASCHPEHSHPRIRRSGNRAG